MVVSPPSPPPPPQNVTLNSSENVYSFPLHRRRPLRSRTYSILIQILSHCRTSCPQLNLQVDSGDSESNSVSEKDGPITGTVADLDDIVPFSHSVGSKNMTVQEDSNNENTENTDFQDGGSDGKQSTSPKLHHDKLVINGELEDASSNRISTEGDMVFENMTVQKDPNNEKTENTGFKDGGSDDKQSTSPKLHHDKFVIRGELDDASSNRISTEVHMVFENMRVQDNSNNEKTENTGFQDGDSDGKQSMSPKLHHDKLVIGGELEDASSNRINTEVVHMVFENIRVQEDPDYEKTENTDFQDGCFDDKQSTSPKVHHDKLVIGSKLEDASSNRISTLDNMISENMIVQEDSNNEKTENIAFQDGGSDGKQSASPKLHHDKLGISGEPEDALLNRINTEDDMVFENLMADCSIQNDSAQEHLNDILDIQMGDIEVDIESFFSMDLESSKGQEIPNNGALLENMSNDAEQELLLKEMELEKLAHNSGGVESSFHSKADEEMEEGEIFVEAGVAGESSDDPQLVEKITPEYMHAPDEHEEHICNDENKGRPKHATLDRAVFNIINNVSNSMNMDRRAPAEHMRDYLSQDVLHDNITQTKRGDAIAPFLGNLTPHGRIFQQNASENQTPTIENGDYANKKKRKRGPSREKKKKKERQKRAEMNRELGVKRLKLQPVLKEKKIVYCRHYLQGRCHEGDKCIFSHDTVPLTKSKPCGHFARHCCMKGDNCPFDHQLSNYPCTSYAQNGFCNRGSNCLFSHEIPANVSKNDTMSGKEGSDPKSTTKPKLKSVSPFNNSNSNKLAENLRVLNQKVGSIIYPASKSPAKGVELAPAKAVSRPSVQPPKGVSFRSNMEKSNVDTNKQKQDESYIKTHDAANTGSNSILKVPSGISQVNTVYESIAPRKVRGINFLSFGQHSADDSSHKLISNLLSSCNVGADKSVVDDINGSNRTSSSLRESIGSLKVNRQMTVNSFSINRTDASSSFVGEKESISKLQSTLKSPSLRLWDQSMGGQNANLSSSFIKSLFSNTPSLVQKTVQSTLSFAAQLEPDIRIGLSHR